MSKARDLADFIADSAIDTAELADNSVTSAKLDETDSYTVAGLTTTGDITFGDNDKAIFGAGSDLQIYHDVGGNSFINESGSGSLFVQGENIRFRNTSGLGTYALFTNGGAVDLYYNNSAKLATTATGIDVTGTAVTDGLTVAGNVSVDGGTIKLDGSYPVGTGNNALGNSALDALTTGQYNVGIGFDAGTNITSGINNIAIGANALKTNITGVDNIAIGRNPLRDNTANNNVAIGSYALEVNTTGTQNNSIGVESLQTNTTGSFNNAFGYRALESNTTNNNSAFGHVALRNTTSGGNNTAVGASALTANTTGIQNVAIGSNALDGNTTGSYNVAIGHAALTSGSFAANNNTGVGWSALGANTTGGNNTAIGQASLGATTTSSNNTAVGKSSLGANTTGTLNAAFGIDAGVSNTTGGQNAYFGAYSGYSATGTGNTFLGYGAGFSVTSGAKNTIIGGYQGNGGGLDIRTSSNNIVLSDGDGNPRTHCDNNGTWTFKRSVSGDVLHNLEHTAASPFGIVINFDAASPDNNSNYYLKCTDSTDNRLFIYSDGDVVNHDNSYGAISDVKLKEQITDASSQWDDIKALNVRKYKMKADVAEKGDSDEHWRLGVIAQELEEAGMYGLIKTSPDMIENEDGQLVESGEYTKQVKYSILYMKAVKALQEAMERIETLEAKVQALETN